MQVPVCQPKSPSLAPCPRVASNSDNRLLPGSLPNGSHFASRLCGTIIPRTLGQIIQQVEEGTNGGKCKKLPSMLRQSSRMLPARRESARATSFSPTRLGGIGSSNLKSMFRLLPTVNRRRHPPKSRILIPSDERIRSCPFTGSLCPFKQRVGLRVKSPLGRNPLPRGKRERRDPLQKADQLGGADRNEHRGNSPVNERGWPFQ